VRAADIEYKLPGESVFRTTTRPIHKLVLIVPVEEQDPAAGRAEQPAPLAVAEPEPVQQEETRAAGVAPPAIKGPDSAHQEESGVTEIGMDPQEAVPQPAQARQREQRAPVRYKKVISRKKAGKQARTIIVSVPKEEEEIMDIGARPRKRGRPRKGPGMDPPDPRKGSVSDPDKGVCADPVNGGAILRRGEPESQGGNKERQLRPDKGGEKT
jgi:hypothetical protein